MGWFSKNDFKRMLLLYDCILYLLPSETVEFEDLDGRRQYMWMQRMPQEGFLYQHYLPDTASAQVIRESAAQDAARPSFAAAVNAIPQPERAYTWRVTNADADLGHGSSLALEPGQTALAHAVLLNKFLIAAHLNDAVPITGQSYIHTLIGDKYRAAQDAATPGVKPSFHPAALRIIQAVVSDEELDRRSRADIVEYKEHHRRLFERFSYTVRRFVAQISALPGSPDFDRQVSEVIDTEVWRDKAEAEREIQNAWHGFFKSAAKSAVGGAVTLGITPFLSLGQLSVASLLAAAGAVAPWALSEFLNVLDKRKQAQQHGMYYLMNFSS
jgi:hypothetical protein